MTAAAPEAGASSSAGNVIVPAVMVGLGGYLAWFAVRYWRGTGAAVWPSYPIKEVLQGKGLPAKHSAQSTAATVTAYEESLAAVESGGTSGTPFGGGQTWPEAPVGQAQNTAKLLLGKYGWGVDELGPLISLWTKESGWSSRAVNKSSGALGIAQALGHGGDDTAGSLGNEYGAEYGLTAAQAQAANSGSVVQQIRWGLGYIKAEYGSPAAAWAHEQAHDWY